MTPEALAFITPIGPSSFDESGAAGNRTIEKLLLRICDGLVGVLRFSLFQRKPRGKDLEVLINGNDRVDGVFNTSSFQGAEINRSTCYDRCCDEGTDERADE